MDARLTRRLVALAIVLVLAAALVGGGWLLRERYRADTDPKPARIVAATLKELRAQGRIATFAARFVAVVTAEQSRFGLTAKKTLIMPGTVRYEVDLARLTEQEVRWDAASRTLTVLLPPIEPSAPVIDIGGIQEYDSGGLLMALTDAGATLEAVNRKAAQAEFERQARAPAMLDMAKVATRRAITRSFALPLRAGGVEAKIDGRFAGDPPPQPGE